MPDRPILFSGPMVRALLDGRKTQTRRVLRYQPELLSTSFYHVFNTHGGCISAPEDVGMLAVDYAPFAANDRLWVREGITRFDNGSCDQHIWYRAGGNFRSAGGEHAYQAAFPSLTGDEEWPFEEGPGGRRRAVQLSFHPLPRWASRLTLLVTEVRVDRLQAISEADAVAEGVEHDTDGWRDYLMPSTQMCTSARGSFETLWQQLHGAESWSANPWTCAITFQVHRANINALPAAEAREMADA